MGKQSSRIYYKENDHMDIITQGYTDNLELTKIWHSRMYTCDKNGTLSNVWEKLDFGSNYYLIQNKGRDYNTVVLIKKNGVVVVYELDDNCFILQNKAISQKKYSDNLITWNQKENFDWKLTLYPDVIDGTTIMIGSSKNGATAFKKSTIDIENMVCSNVVTQNVMGELMGGQGFRNRLLSYSTDAIEGNYKIYTYDGDGLINIANRPLIYIPESGLNVLGTIFTYFIDEYGKIYILISASGFEKTSYTTSYYLVVLVSSDGGGTFNQKKIFLKNVSGNSGYVFHDAIVFEPRGSGVIVRYAKKSLPLLSNEDLYFRFDDDFNLIETIEGDYRLKFRPKYQELNELNVKVVDFLYFSNVYYLDDKLNQKKCLVKCADNGIMYFLDNGFSPSSINEYISLYNRKNTYTNYTISKKTYREVE